MTFSERLFNQLGTRHHLAAPAWRAEANCLGADPSLFFPEPGVGFKSILPQALEYCRPCPVRKECLDDAKGFDGTWGIFGGRAFGSTSSNQRFADIDRFVECAGCGKTLPNQKGGRVRKWCSMNCRNRALKEAS